MNTLTRASSIVVLAWMPAPPALAQSTAFCPGDGSVVKCPCGNNGLTGRGCNNSGSTGGAQLTVAGTTAPDTIGLFANGVSTGSLAIFLQGDVSIAPIPWGDGLRCVGGHLVRLTGHHAFGNQVWAPHEPGTTTISEFSAIHGDPLTPGSVRFYQVYYRDPILAFCAAPLGDSWNASNAVSITW